MATGGPPRQQRRSSAAEVELIFPVDEKCTTHNSVQLNLYCRDCSAPLCAECWEAHHDGHDVAPLGKLHTTLQRRLAQLRDRQTDADARAGQLERDLEQLQADDRRQQQLCLKEHGRLLTRLEEEYQSNKAQEVKRHKAALAYLQQQVEARTQELHLTLQEVRGDGGAVETLVSDLQLLTLQSPVAKVANAIKAAEATLRTPPPPPPTARTLPQNPSPPAPPSSTPDRPRPTPPPDPSDMRKQLLDVAAEIEKERKKSAKKLKDPVAVLDTSLDALQAYVSGTFDQPPGPLQGPAATEAYGYDTMTYISAATAEAAATVLGPAALPRKTTRHGSAVLKLGGEVQHVRTEVRERPGRSHATWWLPAGDSVGRAVTLVLGYTPRRVTYNNDKFRRDEDLSSHNVLDSWGQQVSKQYQTWRH